MGAVRDFRELRVYQASREAARILFEISKRFPSDERFSLTDQIRRSSRSVGANIAEGWRKRRYPQAFISKLSDADTEAAEVQSWLDHALNCCYITKEVFDDLDSRYHHISAQLCPMMDRPEQWCGNSEDRRETAARGVKQPTPDKPR